MMASSYIIETERLWLRPFAPQDTDVLYRLFTDPDVRRYLFDDKIVSRERTNGEIEDSIASFARNGFGMWVVQLSCATEVIGFGGFRVFGEAPHRKKELMYGMAPAHWGRGYATELAQALLRYGFEILCEERLYARTDPPNIASMRVMEKAGMTCIGREYDGNIEVASYVKERSGLHDAL